VWGLLVHLEVKNAIIFKQFSCITASNLILLICSLVQYWSGALKEDVKETGDMDACIFGLDSSASLASSADPHLRYDMLMVILTICQF
jgi:hypothetical protein